MNTVYMINSVAIQEQEIMVSMTFFGFSDALESNSYRKCKKKKIAYLSLRGLSLDISFSETGKSINHLHQL